MSSRSCKLLHGVRTLEVNGYQMAYLERGQGEPLVLVHGSLSDCRAWEHQMDPFSASYHTFAVSLRHCFPEYWNGEGDKFSVRQHTEDLSAFIKKLNVGPVHIVSHSRGGDVALILAAKYPKLIRSMVLADPAPLNKMLPATPEVNEEINKRKEFVNRAMERLKSGDIDSGLEVFTDAVSAPGKWKKLPESIKQTRRDNVWSLKSLITDAQEEFYCDDAREIGVPVLLVTGDQSPRVYEMMHAALERCLKKHQKTIIKNASHRMFRENPEAFNSAVIDFLTKNMDTKKKPSDELNIQYAAVCGLYCRACSWFIATTEEPERLKRLATELNYSEEEGKCYGCRSGKRLPYCKSCKMFDCAARRGINFCSECEEYPCAELKQFQSAMPHRIELWKNLERIKSHGYKKWLSEVIERYICPQCETINSTYDQHCRKCGNEPSCQYVAKHNQVIEEYFNKKS